MSDNKSDIWRLQAQFDIQGLIEALKQDDTGIRKRAAAALRAIGAKEAVPAIRVALINEQDPDVRSILASALDTLSDMNEEVLTANIQPTENLIQINKLIEMLDSEEPEQIIDAAHQLGELGDQIAVEPLVIVFNNPKSSIQVRLAVAEALLKLEGAPVEVALLAALRHTDWHIRRNGAAILGQLKAEWAVEPLARALRDVHSTVRRTARAALQHIGTPEAAQALRQYQASSPRQPKQDAPPQRPTTTTEPTVPSAPRDGLLNRLREQEQKRKGDDHTEIHVAKHSQPTKPLDPRVLEELERRQQAKTTSEQEQTDEDDSS